ncbi:NUDIX_hydrolase-like domain superfamily [Hexamita inflata]|uniref:NUDIX hydrolase-like domain superfamily n=1 Tax=Hexamita inflata TaxID=28002 RepID=A0AA86Q4M8_9EUKA|nr:NUDIX hydrolase-like domain superfamily [Hexamita inflata]
MPNNLELENHIVLILNNIEYQYIVNNMHEFAKNPKQLLYARRACEDLLCIKWILQDQYKHNKNDLNDIFIMDIIAQIFNLPEIEQMKESQEIQYDLTCYKVGAMILTNNMSKFVVVKPYCNNADNIFVSLPGGKIDINDISNFDIVSQNLNFQQSEQFLQCHMNLNAQVNALIREVKEETSLRIANNMIIGKITLNVGKCNDPCIGKQRGDTIITLFIINYQKELNQELFPETEKEIEKVLQYNYQMQFIKNSFGDQSVWTWNFNIIKKHVDQIKLFQQCVVDSIFSNNIIDKLQKIVREANRNQLDGGFQFSKNRFDKLDKYFIQKAILEKLIQRACLVQNHCEIYVDCLNKFCTSIQLTQLLNNDLTNVQCISSIFILQFQEIVLDKNRSNYIFLQNQDPAAYASKLCDLIKKMSTVDDLLLQTHNNCQKLISTEKETEKQTLALKNTENAEIQQQTELKTNIDSQNSQNIVEDLPETHKICNTLVCEQIAALEITGNTEQQNIEQQLELQTNTDLKNSQNLIKKVCGQNLVAGISVIISISYILVCFKKK